MPTPRPDLDALQAELTREPLIVCTDHDGNPFPRYVDSTIVLDLIAYARDLEGQLAAVTNTAARLRDIAGTHEKEANAYFGFDCICGIPWPCPLAAVLADPAVRDLPEAH